MKMHKNAKLTLSDREIIINLSQNGEKRAAIAAALGFSSRTVGKWLKRFRDEGIEGLQDRSSRPKRVRSKNTNISISN